MTDSSAPGANQRSGGPSSHADTSISKVNPFAALGLDAKVVRPLAVLGIKQPTPIQEQAIPLVLEGHDVMGLAQTGTGKTAAFGLPLVQRLLADGDKAPPKGVRALVLAPTRELVNQIADNLRSYVKKTPVWVSSVVGGQSIGPQIKHLNKGTDILVATPGRLLDLVDRNAVKLETVRYLVLDEADQMLDLGFIHALKRIAKLLGTPRQTLLFSATMPPAVAELSKAYLNDPVRVEVAPQGKAADKIEQSLWHVVSKGKADLLKQHLHEAPDALSLVFARTKHGAEKLMKHLVASGFEAVSIHGNKSQGQRDRALKAFRNGEARILVATDVAARGIDIPGVTHVYNYNLPEVPENYVHRIGRTARAGREGLAIAYCSPDERKLLKQVEKLMKMSIPVAGGDGSEAAPSEEPPARNSRARKPGNRGADGKPKKKNVRAKSEDAKPASTSQPAPRKPKRERPSEDKPANRKRTRPGSSRGRPTKSAPRAGNPKQGGKPGGERKRSGQRSSRGGSASR